MEPKTTNVLAWAKRCYRKINELIAQIKEGKYLYGEAKKRPENELGDAVQLTSYKCLKSGVKQLYKDLQTETENAIAIILEQPAIREQERQYVNSLKDQWTPQWTQHMLQAYTNDTPYSLGAVVQQLQYTFANYIDDKDADIRLLLELWDITAKENQFKVIKRPFLVDNRLNGNRTWSIQIIDPNNKPLAMVKTFVDVKAGNWEIGLYRHLCSLPAVAKYIPAFQKKFNLLRMPTMITDYVKSKTRRVYNDIEQITYAKNLIKAVSALHSVGVTHGDIKPGNVLVDSNCNVKLIDFGSAHIAYDAEMCREFVDGEVYKTTAGTRGYMSPECGRKATKSSDMYSIGKTLAKIFKDSKKCRDMYILIDMLTFENPHSRADASEAFELLAKMQKEQDNGEAAAPIPAANIQQLRNWQPMIFAEQDNGGQQHQCRQRIYSN
ncbi:kinase-like domain-containing protein [Syncephalis fuscata]|nr:kinase-like domain-containing protein [Syncephalis fuscata]